MSSHVCEGVDWVGYVDSGIRDFHGYHTNRGSTYNAYLVRDEKTALIDTVKEPYADDLLESVGRIASARSVDFVVCNHAEPDHSSALPAVMKAMPQAELVCNAKCKAALEKHYDTSEWNFKVISDGESISLGTTTLQFIDTPMVHWPESMFTYCPERKVLFSMDAFGQHYASENRFDDEEPLDIVMEEAKTYYANIVMLYGKPIKRVLDKAGGLDIDIVAPSHGVIWRKHLGEILKAYNEWVVCKSSKKVIVLYDTMWQSTSKMAEAIAEGASAQGVQVKLLNARTTHITDLATESLDAAVFAVGSPTLNKTLMPQVAACLTYLKGLAPVGKAGFAFGSYGWSSGGTKEVEKYLDDMKFEVIMEPVDCQFVPGDDALKRCREAGRAMAAKAVEMVDG
ncbi:hypothetical protein BVX97_06430 [bacterium E08(2017)]|nr:hypothetical protein BVX97_06430 [bacterium E08(2017)]